MAAEAERLALGLDSDVLGRLARYVELLVRWGRQLNLTGRAEAAVIVERQLPDGLVLGRELQLPGAGVVPPRLAMGTDRQAVSRVLDVGSGAGLPGLVVGLARADLELELVEPNHKRCAFLRTVVHELALARVTVRCAGVEQLPEERGAVACSRAVWSPAEWLARGRTLVRPGGVVVLFGSRERALPAGATRCVSFTLADGTPRVLGFYHRLPRDSEP